MATLRYRSLEDLNYVTNTLIARIDDWKTTNITICYEVSENLLRQAAVHRRTGDMEREYIALMKFASFHMEKLPKHKQYNDPQVRHLKSEYLQKCGEVISTLEKLRDRLRKAYEAQAKARAAEEAERLAKQRELERQKQEEAKLKQQRLAQRRSSGLHVRFKDEEDKKEESSVDGSSSANDNQTLQSNNIKILTPVPVNTTGDSSSGTDSDLDALIESGIDDITFETTPEVKADGVDSDLLQRARRLKESSQTAYDGGITAQDIEAVFLFGLPKSTESPAENRRVFDPEAIKQVLQPDVVDVGTPFIELSTNNADKFDSLRQLHQHHMEQTPSLLDMEMPASVDSGNPSTPTPSAPPIEEKSDEPKPANESSEKQEEKDSEHHAQTEEMNDSDAFFTKTYKNQQLSEVNQKKVVDVISTATCNSDKHHGSPHSHLTPPQLWPGGAPPPQFVQYQNQQIPVIFSPIQNPSIFQNAQQIVYQPTPNGTQARLPVMYGVPVVFRPSYLNIYNPLTTNKPPLPQSQKRESSSPSTSHKPSSPVQVVKDSKKTTQSGVQKASNVRRGATGEDLPAPQAAVNENLRPIEIDGEIFDGFMSCARSNTVKGIETCGILCGKLKDDESGFVVTHLIIPKQTGTTDTCATTNEDEIFEYQMKHDILTLGWIHTHPTQTCFLSSVDLHTHASYQGLFPEALAVVIAPRDQPKLTDSGLKFIQNCPLKGFHLHDQSNLYETCSHVTLRWNRRKFKVVDMRKR